MGIRLTIKMKGEEGGPAKPQVLMLNDDVITMGRDANCQVVLAQTAVSRNHAKISRDGTLYFVEDLGSSFGTLINGAKLPKGEKRLLRNGDVIAIAQFDVAFDRVADVGSDEEGGGKTSFISRKVVKDVMKGLGSAGEQPYLRVMNGPAEGHKVEIADASEYILGRDESADIQLQDDLVSRRHVKIRRDWDGTHAEDLGSRNGFKVNKKRVQKVTLKDRDEVEIGGVRMLYIDPTEVRETPLVLPDEDDDGDHTNVNAPENEPEPEPAPAEKSPPARKTTTGTASRKAVASAEPEPESVPEPAPSDTESEGDASADEPPPESPSMPNPLPVAEEPSEASRVPRLDLKNKQTLIVLAVVGVTVLIALVLIVLLLVGA